MKRIFFAFAAVLFWMGCGNDPKSANQNNNGIVSPTSTADHSQLLDDTTPKNALTIADNWTIIPGKKIGLLGSDASEEAFINTYGQDNIARRGIGIGERQTVQASVLFPDQPNELIILWKQSAPFQEIAELRVHNDSARWHSETGVQVGMTLSQLQLINRRPFQFYGFEWDYAGLVNDWQGGEISNQVHVFLIAQHPDKVMPHLLGDRMYSSELPEAKAAGLRVGSMTYVFAERDDLTQ